MIQLEIKKKPMSVNEAWQGRRYKSDRYEEYEEELLLTLPKKEMICGFVEIEYKFHLKNAKLTDYDNLIKPLQDILVKKGYIADDRYIYRATIEKIESKEKDFIEISIKKYQPKWLKNTK